MYSPLHPVQTEMSYPDIYRQPYADYNPPSARTYEQVSTYMQRRFSYADLLSGRGCETPCLSDYDSDYRQHPDSPATTIDYEDYHPLSRRNSFVMDSVAVAAVAQDPYSYMIHQQPLDVCHPTSTGLGMPPCDYYPNAKELARNGSISSMSSSTSSSSRPMTPASPEGYYMQSQIIPSSMGTAKQPTKSKSARSRGRRVSNNPAHPTLPAKMFTCTHLNCGKVFKRSEHLKRHVRSIHTLEKRKFEAAGREEKQTSRDDI
ncbi:unnamed protein product [Umbelopsis vinacea]